ncbi:MAG: sigma-70 family RNA polymerase sigma factor [Lachnospiraceae bacterium]|nr:sigma-70 family RNA polymerase sigma factor [Lachnospiraceae bacterium]
MDILVYRAKRRDKEAFSSLIRQHTSSMYKVAKAILKNDDDVADAIQESVLACWEKIDTLKKDQYFKTWLTRILINNCNAICRQRGRMASDDALIESGIVEQSYAAVEWQEFLQCLDEKYRIVIMLYYIEGFKIREIAEILELNENTVSTRLAKARKIMEKQYL